jgi:hypothetical protein
MKNVLKYKNFIDLRILESLGLNFKNHKIYFNENYLVKV